MSELLKPRVYELKRRNEEIPFGFEFECRNSNFYVSTVSANSIANMAGFTVGSKIVEVNGTLAPSTGLQVRRHFQPFLSVIIKKLDHIILLKK